jgi:hypothetical protein
MSETARQTTIERAKGLTIIEMDERTPSPNGSTQHLKPIKPLQRAKTVNLSADEYFVSITNNPQKSSIGSVLTLSYRAVLAM